MEYSIAKPAQLTLSEYLSAIGMKAFHASQHIEELTGVRVPPPLIREACRSKRPQPMARPKAEALVQFLSDHMGRKITIADVKGLEVL